ncbi:hypothetical protein SD457_21435 [Coprobacillaceae bacterium CR2/5/TPMF4]|nr:hypothetical protein SD457_21435 [Coprobacillaceae bacterium CR2/5/TPMF4]
MFIPFVFVPVVNAIIGYFATSWGLVNHLVVLNSGVEPIFVNAWVLGAFTMSPVVLCIVLFIIDLILYYPFVKLQIKQNSIEERVKVLFLSRIHFIPHVHWDREWLLFNRRFKN